MEVRVEVQERRHKRHCLRPATALLDFKLVHHSMKRLATEEAVTGYSSHLRRTSSKTIWCSEVQEFFLEVDWI